MTYPLVWHWRKWPLRSWDSSGDERKGQRCRVLARGNGPPPAPRNILVEFEDGSRVVTSRWAVRRARSDA